MECNNFNENDDFTSYINKPLEGTKTLKNLETAYSGESQAQNRYSFFTEQAQKDGLIQVSRIFEETANNERAHGKIWYKLLHGGRMPHTLENLESAAQAERYEWEDMYLNFAKTAKEEGFEKIAYLFESIRRIENMHMKRYEKLVNDIKQDKVFDKDQPII